MATRHGTKFIIKNDFYPPKGGLWLIQLAYAARRIGFFGDKVAGDSGLGILRGNFGRVALLDMDTSRMPIRAATSSSGVSGADQNFTVEDKALPAREDTAVLVNVWKPHQYLHQRYGCRTVFLALYIEPTWRAGTDRSFARCSQPAFFHLALAFRSATRFADYDASWSTHRLGASQTRAGNGGNDLPSDLQDCAPVCRLALSSTRQQRQRGE
jgi:hypothetical protein